MTAQVLIALLQKADPDTPVEVLLESNWPHSVEIVGAIRRDDLPETRRAGRGQNDILLVCQPQLGPVGAV